MHIPQGMAYALLGGVPPIVGIYMAFFPVLMYFFMGTSRHISMGTFAVVCMMTSKSVILYSSADEPFDFPFNTSLFDENSSQPLLVGTAANMSSSPSYTPIQVATAVCFVVGIWQLVLGIFRLGVVSVLLSDTLVSGFTTGASVHVLSTQVVNLLGVNIPRHSGPLKVVYIFIDIFKNIQTANLVAIGISAITITILACYNEFLKPRVSKKLPIPIPMELMAVVAGTLVSMFTHLKENYGVKVVGGIPTGLPIPAHPPWALIPKILVDGLVIAIVAFSVNMSMASILARKRNYSVDANQELIASGCSNIFGSFFSCIPFAASLSRSLIQESVGGETQIASVVSCGLLLFVLLLIGPFFQPLPNCVLASIVVVALKGMFMQVKDLPRAWRLSPFDGMVWLVTFLSVVLLDIDYGLGIGVALSLLCVIIMGQRPKVCRLGHVPSTNIYLDITRYQASAISGHLWFDDQPLLLTLSRPRQSDSGRTSRAYVGIMVGVERLVSVSDALSVLTDKSRVSTLSVLTGQCLRLTLSFQIRSNTDAKPKALIGQESAPKPTPSPERLHVQEQVLPRFSLDGDHSLLVANIKGWRRGNQIEKQEKRIRL
uniref:SLC26A/SulP transporter domain-containing protein n=1 Tax=Timema shepardi TaxID=629360 RepID=A0A7R9B2K3_TIMSH|nr:unnamed protein product [Timema shepardi]